MRRLTRFGSISFYTALIFSFAFPAFAQGPPPPPSIFPINLSGYEFRLGSPCTINDQAGKCGVGFSGWTGGGGMVSGGWTPFPGDGNGLWKAQVNYIGSADFGHTADLQSGTFTLLFEHRPSIFGTVIEGGVTWPASGNDIGCGTNVATVTVQLLINGVTHYFNGCLHDLPAGTVIPPKIWGELQ